MQARPARRAGPRRWNCLKEIAEVARELGIESGSLVAYGKWMAKIDLSSLGAGGDARRGKLVLVTAMTPTPQGEGKTVTAIGLGMALERAGKRAVVCLRQPSLGPTFGLKGGAAGGGRCTVEPMQEINLHFTGDIDAIGSAHNLLSAMLDNHIYQGNLLRIDPAAISWPRAVDMNDRALRRVEVGVGEKRQGAEHEGSFMITAASEVMAIHGICSGYADLKARLGRVVVGLDQAGRPVTAEQLKAAGAMAVLLKDAVAPNLVQTAEGTPALVHGGPFANIAHGTASLTSILLGLKHAEYCVVEAGFASDLGAEKFVDIVARAGGFEVDAMVVVASVKALRYHGGAQKSALESQDPDAVRRGLENLAKHVENARVFGLTPVVAINKFPTDGADELLAVEEFCRREGVPYAVSTAFAEGSPGAAQLAERVIEAAGRGEKSRPVYVLEQPIEEKLDVIVRRIYGGDGAAFEPEALKDIALLRELGMADRPVCVAKTNLSLSDDAAKVGRPRGFTCTVKRVAPSAGAGFNVAYMGDIVTMPGLPKVPLAESIDLSDAGAVSGLR